MLKVMKKILYIFIMVACVFTACSPKEEPVPEQELKLTVSADSVYCLPIYKDLPALELAWTAGTNHGTGSAIAYTIDMDREGNNFASPLSWEIGRTADRTLALGHKLLADTLQLTYPDMPDEQYEVFELRVRAKVLMSGEQQVSPVVKVAIAYNTTSLNELYLIGDATPNGWDLARATPLVPDMTNFTTFTWSGKLHKGEFKLLTTTADWMPCYVCDSTDAGKMVYRPTEDAYPDFKWTVAKPGSYRITADIKALTIDIEYLGGETYEHIYMIGDATPGGWSWDNLTEMQHPEPNIFTWQGNLNSGQIKFPTEVKSDWSGEMIYAPTPDCAPSVNGTFDIHTGDPDYKWQINEAGQWSIRINISDTTISFTKL